MRALAEASEGTGVAVRELRSGQRPGETARVIVPNRWKGEADCAVGPFSSRDIAAYFASRVVDFGQFEVFTMQVFVRRNAWYVEVHRRRD